VKRLYRIYYSVFDDEAHENLKRILQERYAAKIVDHKSRVHPDFRFIELLLDRPGLEDEIADLVRAVLGVMHVRVDWIDTSR